MRISDWSSDVCSSDLRDTELPLAKGLNVDRKATERAPIAAGIFEQSFVLGNPDVAPFTPHPPVEDDRCNLPAFACASSVTKKVARAIRSEERRVGKECVGTCKSRGAP